MSIIGILQRGGKVRTTVVADRKKKTLQKAIVTSVAYLPITR
jgi:hypothetical protein